MDIHLAKAVDRQLACLPVRTVASGQPHHGSPSPLPSFSVLHLRNPPPRSICRKSLRSPASRRQRGTGQRRTRGTLLELAAESHIVSPKWSSLPSHPTTRMMIPISSIRPADDGISRVPDSASRPTIQRTKGAIHRIINLPTLSWSVVRPGKIKTMRQPGTSGASLRLARRRNSLIVRPPGGRELMIDFPGFLYRVLPVSGRFFVSTNYFCFRSSQLLYKTKVRPTYRL